MKKNNVNKIAIHLHDDDNIAVACENLLKNEEIIVGKKNIYLRNDVGLAHKLAYSNIKKGDNIIKFGMHIGSAVKDIEIGEHVHFHNIKSDYILIEEKNVNKLTKKEEGLL